jgi:AraC family transcriptional activator of pobA
LDSRSPFPAVRSGRTVRDSPVFTYRRVPGTPPIGVTHWGADHGGQHIPHLEAHAHDFLVVAFVEGGGGRLRIEDRYLPIEAGDLLVVAPGEVVSPEWTGDLAGVWAAFFPVDVVDSRAGGALSWRAHPLLFPFVGSRAGGAQRLRVPEEQWSAWSRRFAELERELAERREGFGEAAQALLTLLLIELARLTDDVAEHLRMQDEPLLAAAFDVIEQRYGEPVSLRDVADAVGLTPGHLTTVVGRRTGRTVQQWLTERRMTEARRLLADSRLPVAAIATRVGYRDTGYFIRRFRAVHGVTPNAWRRGG